MRRVGLAVGALWVTIAALAPWIAPYAPGARHGTRAYAPPTRVHVFLDGRLTRPYYHPLAVASPIERRFEEDRSRTIPVPWLSGGRLIGPAERSEPLLVLGADSLGRDIFSRIVFGSRLSLSLALVAAALALGIGAVIGVLAGYAGGRLDALASRLTEIVLVLPALYVVVALRAALPLVLSSQAIFVLVAVIFALVAWPAAARGVRAIVAAERTRVYVEAARAAGAHGPRILVRHLLPATSGFLRTQFALLVPACLLVEAALSFAGLGFPDQAVTWGTMLQEAANIGALTQAPWLLAPGVAMVTVVLAINLIVDAAGERGGRRQSTRAVH